MPPHGALQKATTARVKTRKMWRARELLSGTREESDLIVQLWAAILPRMQKNVSRTAQSSWQDTRSRNSRGARPFSGLSLTSNALAEELDAAAGELERAGSGPAAAAARERAESAECELVCTIVASFGQLMVLLRRVRALRDAPRALRAPGEQRHDGRAGAARLPRLPKTKKRDARQPPSVLPENVPSSGSRLTCS